MPRDTEKPAEMWMGDAVRWHELVQWRLINSNDETRKEVIEHISDMKYIG